MRFLEGAAQSFALTENETLPWTDGAQGPCSHSLEKMGASLGAAGVWQDKIWLKQTQETQGALHRSFFFKREIDMGLVCIYTFLQTL